MYQARLRSPSCFPVPRGFLPKSSPSLDISTSAERVSELAKGHVFAVDSMYIRHFGSEIDETESRFNFYLKRKAPRSRALNIMNEVLSLQKRSRSTKFNKGSTINRCSLDNFPQIFKFLNGGAESVMPLSEKFLLSPAGRQCNINNGYCTVQYTL